MMTFLRGSISGISATEPVKWAMAIRKKVNLGTILGDDSVPLISNSFTQTWNDIRFDHFRDNTA